MATQPVESENRQLVERARNLFEFLGRVQQLKAKPARSTDAYQADGAVIWFADLPEHPAVTSSHRPGATNPDQPLLTTERVPHEAPGPAVDREIAPWIDGSPDRPDVVPTIREAVPVSSVPHLQSKETEDGQPGDDSEQVVLLADHRDVAALCDEWLHRWRLWAERELADRPVRKLYGELFSTYLKATNQPEELELIVGIGCLAWHPDGHPAVRRHLLTSPVSIQFDDNSGRLTIVQDQARDPMAVELDMLDPNMITDPARINDVKTLAGGFDAHPLDREATGELARRLVHTLDADGEYRDDEAAPQGGRGAVVSYAPALILRKRSRQGLVDIFNTIVAQLDEADQVPTGLLPLVDPDRRPAAESDSSPGAVVTIDDELFLPMPVNDRQLRIIKAVDARAQTVVQGPPGTGKTHTAAALLSHLLAQGKRVLVTAHTDRALKEVRQKLPDAIKPLSVAVVGNSRSDMSDLRVAVAEIARIAGEHDSEDAPRQIDASLAAIDKLHRRRAATHQELLRAREEEVMPRRHGRHAGSLAEIAQRHEDDRRRYGWLADFAAIRADAPAPLNNYEINEWRDLLRDDRLRADEPCADNRLFDINALPQPREFADLCVAEEAAATTLQQYEEHQRHEAFDLVRQLDSEKRVDLQRRMQALAAEVRLLEQRPEAWMNDALADIRAGRGSAWAARADQVGSLINHVHPLVEQLGPLTRVEIQGEEIGPLRSLAESLWQHLKNGGSIKTEADGQPKIGRLAAKPVKAAAALFDRVHVGGTSPVTINQLGNFLIFVDAQQALSALDRAWPASVAIPHEDTLHERLQWHIAELEQLRRVLRLSTQLSDEDARLREMYVKPPDWTDLNGLLTYAQVVDATVAKDKWWAAHEPLEYLEVTVAAAANWDTADDCVRLLSEAIPRRDHNEYLRGHSRLSRLYEVRRLLARRAELATRLQTYPRLREDIARTPADDKWSDRLADFEAAWAWATTGAWIQAHDTADTNVLQTQILEYEDRLHHEVEKVAATRAWSHAVSPARLTGTAQADLFQYVSLVRRLGKGTGRYAAQQRVEIRKAVDRCRPAVPVWIMPIYRIAEQFGIHENMFDVVIVDEASQAGVEATFLQYLAPKIVVIGDDKQVSPAAVGTDQQQIRDLARQYLSDERFIASWQDPKRSLFDEAVMRYGDRITLVEHRRCVPEIIGFSNRIAYEPDGVRLIPVRQYGSDRLEPIKAVEVTGGYERGVTAKTNPAETDAIIDQIEKCMSDPRYDGLTFGVISLLGTAQAKAIETKLLERLPPEEWKARDLRCGDAADFQGSERNVIFLSMVAAPTPGRRLGALTQDLYMQRYNVAASRAKDQLWLFHSVGLEDVSNPEDMRFALLDYCYGVINRGNAVDDRIGKTSVPEDVVVDPFDSLFEQRVFNRLVDRGYSVIPQYPVEGYRIDLVVVGAKTRLAIECDGDHWHGPDAYEADLARQRDLQRCGWEFFRIRESAFYVDKAETLGRLWGTLSRLDIHPSGWSAEQSSHTVTDAATPS